MYKLVVIRTSHCINFLDTTKKLLKYKKGDGGAGRGDCQREMKGREISVVVLSLTEG